MKYTTYLFDFDYTLADSSRGIVICFRNVLERHWHTGISDEAIKRTIGKTLEDSFSILSGITTPETLAEYKKEYVKEADTYMTVNTFFFPETVTVLKTLKSQGAQIGIISTKFRFRIREMVDQHFPSYLFLMEQFVEGYYFWGKAGRIKELFRKMFVWFVRGEFMN